MDKLISEVLENHREKVVVLPHNWFDKLLNVSASFPTFDFVDRLDDGTVVLKLVKQESYNVG